MKGHETEVIAEEEWDRLTEEQQHDELNRIFKLRWGINSCCPHFVVVDCATCEQKHIACQLSIDNGEGFGLENADAALECLGPHFSDCPRRLSMIS